jgi:chemotaxis signal transduction protein
MVRFRTSQGRFAVPVQATRAVRLATGLTCVPEQRPEIAGILPGEAPLTVLSVLGAGGEHVLVLESGDRQFGLQVLEVFGVERIEDDRILAAPQGQQAGLFTGTLHDADTVVLIVDPDELAARL